MRQITLEDFLTEEEIKLAIQLKTKDAITEKIIRPNLKRIERDLGQECSADYLGYACEYTVMAASKGA